jgi:hypothetical protein
VCGGELVSSLRLRIREQTLADRKPLLIVGLVWSFAVWHVGDVSYWLSLALRET